MRVSSILRQFCVLVLLLLSVPLALPPAASAQDASWCTEAANVAAGSELYGYTVVSGSGGAGSQIVLGYGGGTLSGGSGNDVLCAWGGVNTLDGGSGNDILIVLSGLGNELYGGSGNDTLIGFVGDYFDGGSGRTSSTEQPVVMQAWFVPRAPNESVSRKLALAGSGFVPNSSIMVKLGIYDTVNNGWHENDQTFVNAVVAFDGTFLAAMGYSDAALCAYNSYFSERLLFAVVVVDPATLNPVYTSELFGFDCS